VRQEGALWLGHKMWPVPYRACHTPPGHVSRYDPLRRSRRHTLPASRHVGIVPIEQTARRPLNAETPPTHRIVSSS